MRPAGALLSALLVALCGAPASAASAAPAQPVPPAPSAPFRADRVEAEVRQLLAVQAEAWNRGDLDAFCSVYEDDALFVSPSGTTRGRSEVLARYRAKYPDAAARGRLSFEVVEVRELPGGAAASLAARWRIDYAGRPAASGSTLLVLAKRPAGWRIVHDASM